VLLLAAVLVGVIAGVGAVAFRDMIGGFHNLLFLGKLSFDYDANLHTTTSPWGLWVILVPVVGALGVAFLVKTFAPEAKGHGVPEVMDAIYYHEGKIRPMVAAVKSLASALSIGSGGAVGREGPIIQIGSTFGSMLGQWIPMSARQRVILVAAGGGAGIAATFDTPIGGILFASELMLPLVNTSSLLCVGLATVVATCIGRLAFGTFLSFNVPALVGASGESTPINELPWFVLLGAVLGVVAWLTCRGIYWFEDFFDRIPASYYVRHMSGMLLVGLMLAGFMGFSSSWFEQPNHYYVEGVGYAAIMDILRGGVNAVGFLLLLGAAKLLATCLTLGSGASGGVFSPCLFIGAALGAAFGGLLNQCFPNLALNPQSFAIAGMAAMIGGTTGGILTAIVMIFEMTRDYTVILPVILTVVVACAVRHRLLRETIYTLKLVRRGHTVPRGLQAWFGREFEREPTPETPSNHS
jgi:CIC family chloride channel protein